LKVVVAGLVPAIGVLAEACAAADRSIQHAHADSRDEQMFKFALAGLVLALWLGVAHAQDIAGIEDCTKPPGLDKRTSCLQSNINFLQRLLTKNALEAGQQLSAARNEIIALKSAVAGLQVSVQQLQAAQKPAGDKKPESK
jgi:hypothetical protein